MLFVSDVSYFTSSDVIKLESLDLIKNSLADNADQFLLTGLGSAACILRSKLKVCMRNFISSAWKRRSSMKLPRFSTSWSSSMLWPIDMIISMTMKCKSLPSPQHDHLQQGLYGLLVIFHSLLGFLVEDNIYCLRRIFKLSQILIHYFHGCHLVTNLSMSIHLLWLVDPGLERLGYKLTCSLPPNFYFAKDKHRHGKMHHSNGNYSGAMNISFSMTVGIGESFLMHMDECVDMKIGQHSLQLSKCGACVLCWGYVGWCCIVEVYQCHTQHQE